MVAANGPFTLVACFAAQPGLLFAGYTLLGAPQAAEPSCPEAAPCAPAPVQVAGYTSGQLIGACIITFLAGVGLAAIYLVVSRVASGFGLGAVAGAAVVTAGTVVNSGPVQGSPVTPVTAIFPYGQHGADARRPSAIAIEDW